MPEHSSHVLALLDEMPPPPYNSVAGPVGPTPTVPTNVVEENTPNFELLINVLRAPKRVRTANRKTKTEKQDALSFGPMNVPITSPWVDFLSAVAQLLQSQSDNLAVTSFQWHRLKPASGPWLLLQNETGYQSMIKQVTSKPEPYVIVRMQPPKTNAAAIQMV